jgi:ABC-type uncharacterized transport system permease subunit
MKIKEALGRLKNNKKSAAAGKNLLKQVALIFVALLLSSLFLLLTGYDPLIVFKAIAKGITSDIGGTVRWMIPYGFAGLAIALTFRMGIFNMGVDGQLYMGAIAATFISMKMAEVPSFVAVTATIVFAAVAGGLFALVPALLKVKLKCDEVVVTILLNYVAYYFTDYVVLGPMLGSGTLATARSTDYIPENLFLPKLEWLGDSNANIGLYLMLAVMIGLAFVLYKTRFGYEIKICGANPTMARYGGINAGKTILLAMIISGIIAGAAGAVEVLGVHHRFPIRFSDQIGNDGVVVSLLANNNPFGILLTAFFFAALKNGSMIMQRIADVPSALVDIVRGIIIFTISAKFAFKAIRNHRKEKNEGKEKLQVEGTQAGKGEQ